jgi:uncharacterized protein YjbI with pentapeptide repeats
VKNNILTNKLLNWLRNSWHYFLIILIAVGLFYYLWDIYKSVGFLRWSGFRDKTLWDILELIIVPLVLAVGGYLLNRAQRTSENRIAMNRLVSERAIANDRLQESALQFYLDRMTELLLEKELLESNSTGRSDVRSVARTRTLSVLRGLDGRRKGIALLFLHESDLVNKDNLIISLEGADLKEVKLRNANLENVNLSKADLRGADLQLANLTNANLEEADFYDADMSYTIQINANLKGACLIKTDMTGADLTGAILEETNMHDTELRLATIDNAEFSRANISEEQLSKARSSEGVKF